MILKGTRGARAALPEKLVFCHGGRRKGRKGSNKGRRGRKDRNRKDRTGRTGSTGRTGRTEEHRRIGRGWCERRDLNPHGVTRWNLNPVR